MDDDARGDWGIDGLGRAAETLYEDLLEAGPGGLPLSSLAADGVGQLTRAGLARVDALAEGPPQVFAVPAGPVLDRRLKEHELALSTLRAVSEDLTERFHRRHGGPRTFDELHGVQATSEAMSHLQSTARRSVRAFDCGPYLSDPPIVSPEQADATARGVLYRVVYELTTDPAHLQVVRSSVALGEIARMTRRVPMRMTIADDDRALMLFARRGSGGRAVSVDSVLVRGGAVLEALVELFEMVWELALPLPAEGSSTVEPMQPILTLLASGASDSAVARHLGVSERTVQRRVAELLRRHGVDSRFQLGYQVARRALLAEETAPPDPDGREAAVERP